MKYLSFCTFTLLLCSNAYAAGALDGLDYRVKENRQFKTSRDAIANRVQSVQSTFAGWYNNPDTLPDDTLTDYRKAVRAYAFAVWKGTDTGMGTIESWNTNNDVGLQITKFYKFTYPKEVKEAQEITLAKALFNKDYEQNIKPKIDTQVKEVNAKIDGQKQELDGACKSDVVSQLFRVTLGNLLMTVGGNFQAAKNESGFGAQIIRATTGVSVEDIVKYGIVGGKSSELSKINDTFDKALDNVGLGKSTVAGQAIQIFNPANIHIPNIAIPKKVGTNITINKDSVSNVVRNITLGAVHF